MAAEVTGCTEQEGFWTADSIDITCTDARCESMIPGPLDTQSLWQPIIDHIKKEINAHWHFGRVENVA